MSAEKILARLESAGHINVFDLKLALFMRRLYPDLPGLEMICVALASQSVCQGHVCLDFQVLSDRIFRDDEGEILVMPGKAELMSMMSASSLCGNQNETPLKCDGSRLYLQKYFRYEQYLAQMIRFRLHADNHEIEHESIQSLLDSLFEPLEVTDWQRVAAITALLKGFCIITGGPGTGKTTTVVKILALLLSGNHNLKVSLAAPTGKAAARLQDSIVAARDSLQCDSRTRQLIPAQVVTVHRLLGWQPEGKGFRYNADNLLDLDVLIVDEVSMVDMLMMTRLMQAVPDHARVIFLGDENQLASVEAGSVLAELVGNTDNFSAAMETVFAELVPAYIPASDAMPVTPLNDSVVTLKKSHRFGETSTLGQFARAINDGDVTTAMVVLEDDTQSDVKASWGSDRYLMDLLLADAVKQYRPYLQALKAAKPITEVFQLFEAYRVLCAHRVGPTGTNEINALLEQALPLERSATGLSQWYVGRPVMVNRNMPEQGLFNGDVGICIEAKDYFDGFAVYFPQGDGNFRAYATQRLANVETVYAMTIHKSQGSEFAAVGLMLGGSGNASVSRELIYTGVTRSRARVNVYADKESFGVGLQKRTRRYAGLRQQIDCTDA